MSLSGPRSFLPLVTRMRLLLPGILCGWLCLGGPASPQAPQSSPETVRAVDTGRGRGDFLVLDPLAETSAAVRHNHDRADKAGRVPPPTEGWVFHAAVVVQTTDAPGLQGLAAGFDARSVEPAAGAPGFWLVRAASVREALDLVPVFQAAFGTERAYLDTEAPRALRGTPNDPLFSSQWHLRNTSDTLADANAEGAWDAGYTGAGTVTGVLEGGWQTNHPDLAANYNATASQSGGTSSHATSVAGVIGAVGDNGQGVIGMAYGGQISQQVYGSASQTAGAFSFRNDLNDIKNNSWGPFDDGTRTYITSVELAALESSALTGRNGLGEIFAWAAGNGGTGDRVEYDPYASSRLTLAIGAITDGDVRSWYNEQGSSMLVCAHSDGGSRGITSTTSGSGYTSGFGGTSSASPLGAGVVACMLEANPTLTWRDVQHVLVNSARKNHPGDSDWTVNGAGHDVSYDYGFGAVDAGAATAMAAGWGSVGPQEVASTGPMAVNAAIPDDNSVGISRSALVGDDLTIEHVEVVLNIDHSYVGDLEIELTAPSGTTSLLAKPRSDSQNDYVDYVFTSVRHWDEGSQGTWMVRVSDEAPLDAGTWIDWELKIYGTDPSGGPGNIVLVVSDPLAAFLDGDFDVYGGTPNAPAHVYYSKREGSTTIPALGVELGLRSAQSAVPPTSTDEFGHAHWTRTIPPRAQFRTFYIQAAQLGRVSNIVTRAVL